MVLLVAVVDVAEYLNGLIDSSLFYQNLLETTLKGTILLDAVAVFVQGGGSDALDFASCEGWFEQVGGIHASRSVACSHDVVDFVDEKYDVGIVLQLVDDGTDALLKLSTVFSACHHSTHVERDDATVVEHTRHSTRDDAHGKSFNDC